LVLAWEYRRLKWHHLRHYFEPSSDHVDPVEKVVHGLPDFGAALGWQVFDSEGDDGAADGDAIDHADAIELVADFEGEGVHVLVVFGFHMTPLDETPLWITIAVIVVLTTLTLVLVHVLVR
jgi:hypothetical protein